MRDQDLYDQVADEILRNEQKPGLWARAVAETDSKGHPRARYIQLRVEELRRERKQSQRESRAEQLSINVKNLFAVLPVAVGIVVFTLVFYALSNGADLDLPTYLVLPISLATAVVTAYFAPNRL